MAEWHRDVLYASLERSLLDQRTFRSSSIPIPNKWKSQLQFGCWVNQFSVARNAHEILKMCLGNFLQDSISLNGSVVRSGWDRVPSEIIISGLWKINASADLCWPLSTYSLDLKYSANHTDGRSRIRSIFSHAKSRENGYKLQCLHCSRSCYDLRNGRTRRCSETVQYSEYPAWLTGTCLV